MEPRITSTKNPLVKRFRALQDRAAREAEGRIVVEGIRMLEGILSAGLSIELLLYDPSAADSRSGVIITRAQQAGARLIPASPHVIAACSSVETPQGMVAIVAKPTADLSTLLSMPHPLVVVADRIQDPGNLGTIVRIADAAGAAGVLVTRGSADPYNPKTIRGTMGSLFHLPVVQTETDEAIGALARIRAKVLVADQEGAVEYTQADYRPPVAIVLGNEGQGPDRRWVEAADSTVRIPLYGRAESLNVAVAAGLLLYEARRAVQKPVGSKQ